MYKRGNIWWSNLRPNGRKRQVSLETGNKKLATEIEAKLKAEIVEGRYFDRRISCSKTFEDLTQKFMEEHACTVSDSTRGSYANSIKNCSKFFKGQRIADISPKSVSRYKVIRRKKGAKPSTINRELAMLSKAFNLAVREWEWVRENPVLKVSYEREDNERDRWLSHKEAVKLVKHCDEYCKPVVIFALNTGMRQDEILSLEWQSVDLKRETVVIMKSKNGRRRTLPLTEAALSVLHSQAKIRHIRSRLIFPDSDGMKFSRHALSKRFKVSLKKTGIEDFRFHDLRHTFATWLAQSGHDIYFIAKWLGHKDISMTQRYAHHCVDSLRRGVEGFGAVHNLATIEGSGELVGISR